MKSLELNPTWVIEPRWGPASPIRPAGSVFVTSMTRGIANRRLTLALKPFPVAEERPRYTSQFGPIWWVIIGGGCNGCGRPGDGDSGFFDNHTECQAHVNSPVPLLTETCSGNSTKRCQRCYTSFTSYEEYEANGGACNTECDPCEECPPDILDPGQTEGPDQILVY